MDKISSLLEYFKSLVDCLYHQYFSLKEKEDVTDFIYEYMLDENKDFSEFSKDYINCEEYDVLDKKDILGKIMYTVYFMMKFYFDNFNKDLVDYEDDERIYKGKKIEEKIKKYCIY